MKKLSICFLMIMCLFITGCGEEKTKEVVSIDDFTTVATNNNFTVNENTETYKNVEYITDAKLATSGDIQIEMIKYTDSDSAEQVLMGHIESFNLLKSSGAAEKNIKGDNYHKYFLVSNNRYMISVRVEDTLIFCKTLLTNKETVDKIFDELGY